MQTYFAVSEGHSEVSKAEMESLLRGVGVVLKSWAERSYHCLGISIEEKDPLYLEFSVKFSGRFSGILNLRTTPEVAKGLLGSSQDALVRHCSTEEIFKKFAAVITDRLMAYLWADSWGFFISEAPMLSVPGNWLANKTMACGTFVVKRWPVEVRLYTDKVGVKNEAAGLSLKEKKSA